ncbi:MAG: autotransporter outer membrane beta-barrel domain-containing protein [Hyphomicrobiales bacterium]|nr:autotransporter outer membrane beta-barrel domain-containing protein [Hyphomicrobiales bacterium]MBV9589944.1 autotransporter outer membrane beta-barrel domain-containing protein [Hyphomicrobiales bacterium]
MRFLPLLATTCVAALLLAAPAHAGQAITGQTVATVSNGTGQVTTSIVITGSTVMGAVTNAGTIAPGKVSPNGNASTVALAIFNSSVGGGGFGALSVNAADSNSFQTTLGVRLTSRIVMAGYGTLIPEVRLGWRHEFLDASQSTTAALVGVPGSSFSATGIAFGRDAALIGAGFSMELSPEAKVFVDYDGRLASRVQEHSISGGLRVRF